MRGSCAGCSSVGGERERLVGVFAGTGRRDDADKRDRGAGGVAGWYERRGYAETGERQPFRLRMGGWTGRSGRGWIVWRCGRRSEAGVVSGVVRGRRGGWDLRMQTGGKGV